MIGDTRGASIERNRHACNAGFIVILLAIAICIIENSSRNKCLISGKIRIHHACFNITPLCVSNKSNIIPVINKVFSAGNKLTIIVAICITLPKQIAHGAAIGKQDIGDPGITPLDDDGGQKI